MQPHGLASLLFSSYSPYALLHLPQPTPNDLPSGCDGNAFGFQDAFEDLLAVSNGQPLPDINRRYQQKLALREMFPSGEPMGFWHSRLAAAGLLSGYRASRNLDQFTKSDFEALHSELRSKANEIWGRRMRRQAIQEMIEDDTHGGPLRRDRTSAAKERLQSQRRHDEALEMHGHSNNTHKAQQEASTAGSKPLPETELELSEALHGLAESGQRTWDAFAKSFVKPLPHILESLFGLDGKAVDDASRAGTQIEEEFAKAEKAFRDIARQLGSHMPTPEQQPRMDAARRASPDNLAAQTEREQPSHAPPANEHITKQRNTRIEESEDRHCDEYGYIHSKVIRKEIDEDGVEVGRTETYAMYPAPDRVSSPSDESATSKKKQDKTGWFWR
ncbi:uncharacterized protein F5Z01DRAFT_185514 [Emericellopsis atlantica]|uniref:Uncharacterized protein n=1 Tax=Emericellopsis atlantica TaxID=2614577 RepID=A0A9P7ZJ97_9HYPO|nr:uncharacterized protein F5Z01DRAFT_185514 [Emericellopsis atlantica]KAG9252787.1 hypothetical protein F5Z01DRAFT_185514 [Emericellopsis atlantica]